MQCREPAIKELIPAYLEGSAASADRTRVEQHLQTCTDCSSEAEMLRSIASGPVPDPGEAFWNSMPGRVFRDLNRQPERRLTGLLAPFLTLRWAAVAAIVALVSLAGWHTLGPEQTRKQATVIRPGAVLYSGLYTGDALLPEDLSPDAVRLGDWASGELASLSTPLSSEAFLALSSPQGLDEILAALDEEEIDSILRELKKNPGGAS